MLDQAYVELRLTTFITPDRFEAQTVITTPVESIKHSGAFAN